MSCRPNLPMPVTHPKLSASLCLTAALLLAVRLGSAQSIAPKPEMADATTSDLTAGCPRAAQQPPPRPGTSAKTRTNHLARHPKKNPPRPKGDLDQPASRETTRRNVAPPPGRGDRHDDRQRPAHNELADPHQRQRSAALQNHLGRRRRGHRRPTRRHVPVEPDPRRPAGPRNRPPERRSSIDSLAVSEAIQLVTLRDRPNVNNAKGSFFSSSPLDCSFPSNHAAAAWAMASVVGDEYPGWLTRTAVYGLATGVSVSRVLAEQHFPSDVLVGSAAGWLIGHYVYRAHHNYTLNPFDTKPMPRDMGAPRTHPAQPPPTNPTASQSTTNPTSTPVPQPTAIVHPPPQPLDEDVDPDTIGSTNVPMDSWIYPALERLAAMGFIPGQSSAIRPWTRQECLRQLRLAEDLADSKDASYSPSLLAQAHLLMADLHTELETTPIPRVVDPRVRLRTIWDNRRSRSCRQLPLRTDLVERLWPSARERQQRHRRILLSGAQRKVVLLRQARATTQSRQSRRNARHQPTHQRNRSITTRY